MDIDRKNRAAPMALARINDLLSPGESDPELMAQMLRKVALIASCQQCGGAGAYIVEPAGVRSYGGAKRCEICNPIDEEL